MMVATEHVAPIWPDAFDPRRTGTMTGAASLQRAPTTPSVARLSRRMLLQIAAKPAMLSGQLYTGVLQTTVK